MALWTCNDCTARYSVGAPKCPECGSTEHTEEGAEPMPKTTVHGGPSIADTEVVVVGEHGVELDPAPAEEPREEEDSATEAAEPSPEEQDETSTQRRSRRRNQSTTE